MAEQQRKRAPKWLFQAIVTSHKWLFKADGKEIKANSWGVGFNPLTPISDQDRISPYNINAI